MTTEEQLNTAVALLEGVLIRPLIRIESRVTDKEIEKFLKDIGREWRVGK